MQSIVQRLLKMRLLKGMITETIAEVNEANFSAVISDEVQHAASLLHQVGQSLPITLPGGCGCCRGSCEQFCMPLWGPSHHSLRPRQKLLCRLLGVNKTRTTPLHPQSDGMVERFNRTIALQVCGQQSTRLGHTYPSLTDGLQNGYSRNYWVHSSATDGA